MRRLDRDKTVVLLPVGMVEEHGEHLPLGTDNYGVDGLLLAAASWLLEEDHGLHILLMPTLPYGTDPVDNRRPDMFTTAGSVWISPEALKAIVLDVTGHMVRYGFRHIFPVSFHGGAGQIIALDEVCAEMRAEYPGLVMYEPTGYLMAGAELDVSPGLATLLGRPLSTQEEVALRSSVHGSMFETSMMLHLKPELVDPSYKTLRTIEWSQMYKMDYWPGYIGAGPAHSNADVGGAVLRWRGVRAATLMRRAIDGEDISQLPRHPTWLNDDEDSITEAPGEDELPSHRVPEVDSKPEMYISRREMAEARARLQGQVGPRPEGDVQPAEVTPPADSPSSDDTKPASSTATFHHRRMKPDDSEQAEV